MDKQIEEYIKLLTEKYAESLKEDIKSNLFQAIRKTYNEDDFIKFFITTDDFIKNKETDTQFRTFSSNYKTGNYSSLKKNTEDLLRENLLKTSQAYYDEYNDLDQYEIKSKLKEYLDERGITQTWLCDKTRISRSTLVMILKKPESANLLNIHKIAKILGVPIEQIFPFEEIGDTLAD